MSTEVRPGAVQSPSMFEVGGVVSPQKTSKVEVVVTTTSCSCRVASPLGTCKAGQRKLYECRLHPAPAVFISYVLFDGP